MKTTKENIISKQKKDHNNRNTDNVSERNGIPWVNFLRKFDLFFDSYRKAVFIFP